MNDETPTPAATTEAPPEWMEQAATEILLMIVGDNLDRFEVARIIAAHAPAERVNLSDVVRSVRAAVEADAPGPAMIGLTPQLVDDMLTIIEALHPDKGPGGQHVGMNVRFAGSIDMNRFQRCKRELTKIAAKMNEETKP